MLRVWVTVSLLLTAAFMGIGLLVFRQWGRSESALDGLYLVYYQASKIERFYFIVDMNDASKVEELNTGENVIGAGYDCSPDGKTLAFITASYHLHVIRDGQVLYDKPVETAWDFNVANDGSVILRNQFDEVWIVDAAKTFRILLPQPGYKIMRIASDGRILWRSPRGILVVTSINEEGALTLLNSADHIALSSDWLGDEETVIFESYEFHGRSPYGNGRYIVDARTQQRVLLNNAYSSIYSPDGTIAVDRQFGIIDSLTNTSIRPITFSDPTFSPVCFLTFRPQMLIAGS